MSNRNVVRRGAIVAAVMLLGGAVIGILALGPVKPSGNKKPAAVGLTPAADDPSLAPLYDVPRLEKIKIDGDGADWGDDGLKVNVLAARGELASLEATVDAEGFPARRDLHLLATDGEITHRTGQDDLLWSEGRAGVFAYPADAPGREVAAWLDGPATGPGNLAGGGELRRNLVVARALADSLASGEPRAVTEVVSR